MFSPRSVPSISFLYYFSMVLGLAPFQYDKNSQRFSLSKTATARSITISVIYLCFITVANYEYIYEILSGSNQHVEAVVNVMALSFVLTKAYIIIIFHILNRGKFVKIFNHAQLLICCEPLKFCDDEYLRAYKFKIFVLYSQTILLITVVGGYNLIYYVEFSKSLSTIICYLILHSSTILYSYVFYCGCLAIPERLFRFINYRIHKIIEGVENRIYVRDGTDVGEIQVEIMLVEDFNKVALLYDRIVMFIESLQRAMGIQILATVLESFASILSVVSTFSIYLAILESYFLLLDRFSAMSITTFYETPSETDRLQSKF